MALPYSKIPFWVFVIIAFLSGCILTYWMLGSDPADSLPFFQSSISKTKSPCGYEINRVKGFELIQPLLSAESECESPEFAHIKTKLSLLVDSLKNIGAVTEMSVYLKEFSQGHRFEINGSSKYHPASLMKVALLLSSLRVAEATPGLLTQKLVYSPPAATEIKPQYFQFPSIQPGQQYTVHDLLYYMIANSDNHATWMLGSRLDPNSTPKLFFDLGLPKPIEDKDVFTMTAKEASVFMNAIFNSSYLSPEYSEYAARLLSNCAFKRGFGAGFPKETKMWHKFGEWRSVGYDFELHESGIIFIEGAPFLMTVMTKGKDTEKQADCLALVAKTIHKMLVHKGIRKVGSLPRNGTEALNP